jgi:hypothetical protein
MIWFKGILSLVAYGLAFYFLLQDIVWWKAILIVWLVDMSAYIAYEMKKEMDKNE